MPDRPTVLDLFCGAAGGWSLGMHRAGFATVAACEIDPWRRLQFSHRNPEVLMYGDIRQLSADRLYSDGCPDIDVIVGSPPCQDASSANAKGKGVDGERTGLFFEALRLVREVRPRWVCLENVPGLKSRGYDRVHDELEAAGYEVRPLVVGAWHAGAPHRRNRVWIIANAKSVRELQPQRGISDERRRAGDICEQWVSADDAHTPLLQRPSLFGASLQAWQNWNGGPPDLGRVDDGLPKGMARQALSAFGDAVCPQITEAIGRVIRPFL